MPLGVDPNPILTNVAGGKVCREGLLVKMALIWKMNSRKTRSLYTTRVCGVRIWQLSSNLGGQSEDEARRWGGRSGRMEGPLADDVGSLDYRRAGLTAVSRNIVPLSPTILICETIKLTIIAISQECCKDQGKIMPLKIASPIVKHCTNTNSKYNFH